MIAGAGMRAPIGGGIARPCSRWLATAALALGLSSGIPNTALAQDLDGDDPGLEHAPTPIELEVDPERLEWPGDHSIEISGTTAIDAADPRVTLTLSAPSGHRYGLEPAPVADDGSFALTLELNATPIEQARDLATGEGFRLELGEYELRAVSPGRFGSASASFAIVREETAETQNWVEPANELARRSTELVANLETCVARMSLSPARDELRRRIAELRRLLEPAGVPIGRYLSGIVTELAEAPDEFAWLADLLEPLDDELDAWGKEAARRASEIRHDPARCLGAGVCDFPDLIREDLLRLREAIMLLERPVDRIAGYRDSPELAAELKKHVMADTKYLYGQLDAAKHMLETAMGIAVPGRTLKGWFSDVRHAIDVATLAAGRELFDPFCEKFEGTLSARMEAAFTSVQGQVWWRYEIELDGEIALRYPTTMTSGAMPMTGELTGCATRFKSWDDALRVGWPTLLAGSVIFRTAKEPFAEGDGCAEFDLPVTATLEGDEIVLTLEPTARKDFGEPAAEVTYVIASMLAGGLPAQTSFTLPYRNAHFIMTRALEDRPLRLPVSREGEQLVVETELRSSRAGDRAEGRYSVSLKACNPSCAGGGASR